MGIKILTDVDVEYSPWSQNKTGKHVGMGVVDQTWNFDIWKLCLLDKNDGSKHLLRSVTASICLASSTCEINLSCKYWSTINLNRSMVWLLPNFTIRQLDKISACSHFEINVGHRSKIRLDPHHSKVWGLQDIADPKYFIFRAYSCC